MSYTQLDHDFKGPVQLMELQEAKIIDYGARQLEAMQLVIELMDKRAVNAKQATKMLRVLGLLGNQKVKFAMINP